MRKIYLSIIGAVVVLALVACGKDNPTEEPQPPQPDKVEVEITTEVLTRATTQVTETLETDGQEMAVFISSEAVPGDKTVVTMQKVSREEGEWKLETPIELAGQENKFLGAFHPYSETATYPRKIAVEVLSQTDYLYSGSFQKVSYVNPKVKFSMKHALSILAFNLKKESYEGEGTLQKITVSGKGIYVEGEMDLTTGEITGSKNGTVEREYEQLIASSGWKEDIPDLFCIPFSSSGENVTVTFTIDDKEYQVLLPAYNIAKGVKYIFSAALTHNGLTLFETPEVVNLNTDESSMPTGNYSRLKITHQSQNFVFPLLQGNGIVGTVTWGDGFSEKYASGLQHEYITTGTHILDAECWNATEVTIQSLKDVEAIDLSGF